METVILNIAMLGHKRIPSRDGGIEVVVEELSSRMVESGHNITCFNRKCDSANAIKLSKVSVYRGINLKEIFTVNKKGLAAMTSSLFACIATALGRYDVVHIHAEGPAFFSFFPKLFGKKVVVTIHGLDWNRAKWGQFASWYIKIGERHAVKYADEIIVLSQGIKDYFWNEYKRETTYISNGVNLAKKVAPNIIKKRWGLVKDSYVLYLGRIVPEKGEHYLVKAWKSIDTDKKLVIAGGASDTALYVKELKELAKGDERIIFTDFVQGELLSELYSNSLIYCLPSDLEGMPLSLLEAMSYGNCCLVSDIPECSEVVEDKAVLFRHGNVEDLKDKLSFLLTNTGLIKRYKEEAADYICNKYSWDDVVKKTLDLYKGS